jgi:uncharacterized membrane protein
MTTLSVLERSAVLGVAAGMRSLAAPAALSRHLATDPTVPHGIVDDLLSRPLAPRLLTAASAVEHVGDKLSITPPRIEPAPLAGRIAAGALCGFMVARRAGEPAVTGALVGGIAAAVATFAAYHLRRALTVGAGIPDLPVALAEDVAAVLFAETGSRG